MKIEDFEIGKEFYASAGFKWRCTDIGTRTILAIMIDPKKDKSWFEGPPYAVCEEVFDRHDMKSCYTDDTEMLIERISSLNKSSHPNFSVQDVFKMISEKEVNDYPRTNLLKRDRVSLTGEILHPYTAIKENEEWFIKTFELFSKEYNIISEDIFLTFKIATEQDMFDRKKLMEKK